MLLPVRNGGVAIGANWDKNDVIDIINNGRNNSGIWKLAILSEEQRKQNFGHSVSIITDYPDNTLYCFDIGIKDNELEIIE